MTIVQIEWVDSARLQGWRRSSDLAGREDMKCCSAGILVTEDDDTVTITTTYNHKHGTYFDPLTIPRSAIVGYWEIELE